MTPQLKSFLKKTGLYALVVLVILAVGEVMVEKYPNPFAAQRKAVESYGSVTETLFLGNSHFFYGVIADSIPNSLNLAMPGQDLDYMWSILKTYRPQMPNLKKVVVSMSYFSFFDPPTRGSEYPTPAYYAIYMGVADGREMPVRLVSELTHATQSYCGKLRSILMNKENPDPTTSHGFGLRFRESASPGQLEREADETVNRHNTIGLGLEDTNRRFFERLAGYCRDNDLELAFVITPYSRPYREKINPMEVRLTGEIVEEYRKEYGFEFLDLSDDPYFTYEDFHDPDHLSLRGARKLTRKLKTWISKPQRPGEGSEG